MKDIKDELQNIILGDEQIGSGSQLKETQSFLRSYAEASISIEKQQRFKDEETTALIKNFSIIVQFLLAISSVRVQSSRFTDLMMEML